MTQHHLQGRSDTELLWFQRRGFLQAAAAWTAAVGINGAIAQSRGNVVELVGDATVNGQRLRPDQTLQTGDEIATGPGSTLIFAVGNSAFHVRQNSNVMVERGATLNAVSLLRILTGAVVSVWGKGGSRRIVTPTLTAGIRGTGVYTEVLSNQGGRTYFCNCYGVVDLVAAGQQEVSETSYHQSFWAEPAGQGSALTPARMLNHSDREVENLARLIGQRTAWQISGKKGSEAMQREYGG